MNCPWQEPRKCDLGISFKIFVHVPYFAQLHIQSLRKVLIYDQTFCFSKYSIRVKKNAEFYADLKSVECI
jgi:hypothetical protein